MEYKLQGVNYKIDYLSGGLVPYVLTIPKTKKLHLTDIYKRVVLRDKGQCQICLSRLNLELDHIIPTSKGGKTTVTNLQVLCRSCNRRKGNKIYTSDDYWTLMFCGEPS